ncbi:MAG: magnesium transporter CorA family protein [Solirubrobacterales bacterium]|nr:magnesium transporter CorA family protein [Solirubrobacterales bacterium]
MAVQTPCLHNATHADIAHQLDAGQFFWLDLEDPSPGHIERLGRQLGLHEITLEDALHFGQRPRYEDYPGYASLVVCGVDPGTESGGPLLREVHVIVSGNYVVTIHRRPFQALAELRARYAELPARSEQFLIYKILDTITQTFFPVLARVDDTIDEIEEQLLANPTPESLARIVSVKRDLVAMRRVVTPLRDVFARNVERISDLPGLEVDDHLFFRDLYDSVIHIGDLVDSYRDLASGATDLYLSTVANRQGDISKQLAIIATIFLPLTFLTGFFGQNFAFLTGNVINHTWTFFVLGLGLLVASVIGFTIFFRTRKWI